jgi:4-amino-4-deoxy-L-arabinose transferase-like glycosyltransferase
LLTALTVACLLPFSAKPFHMDDPLFVWVAQHIVQHPLNPYGFDVVWYMTAKPMSAVTKNPPLACYYGALITLIGGVSERAWHVGFMIPAVAVVLGTFRLARRFTGHALPAALMVLFAPGFLVSSTGVMCDTMMLAFWVWAAIFWIEGLDSDRSGHLFIAGLLTAGCALTKYFGMSLIPVLLSYSILRACGFKRTLLYLLVPLFVLAGYQIWTGHLYGHGLLSDAMEYAGTHQDATTSLLGKTLEGLAFAGGCTIAAVTFLPLLWSRLQILCACVAGAIAGLLVAAHWVKIGAPLLVNWTQAGIQLGVLAVGGVSLIALLLWDPWKRRDADSAFLSLWALGTFVFAVFLNWTVNARSILPLIPAVAILLARRLETRGKFVQRSWWLAPLALAGGVALWASLGDMRLANATRDSAQMIVKANGGRTDNLYFQGHWGFQYYMQALGAHPFDPRQYQLHLDDVVVIPENNTNQLDIRPDLVHSSTILTKAVEGHIATMSQPMGAGFYSSLWGPMPFVVGPVPPERFQVLVLQLPK